MNWNVLSQIVNKFQIFCFLINRCTLPSVNLYKKLRVPVVWILWHRRLITCCFDKHTCIGGGDIGGWEEMQDTVYTEARWAHSSFINQARDFLQDKQRYLDTQVRPMGYKTCHLLNTSLDATACAEDCRKFEKQSFAKDCHKQGGFFKCCIRRDAGFCHECR